MGTRLLPEEVPGGEVAHVVVGPHAGGLGALPGAGRTEQDGADAEPGLPRADVVGVALLARRGHLDEAVGTLGGVGLK